MSTTTFEAIRDQYIAEIKALTPAIGSTQPEHRFNQSPLHQDLREWARGTASSAVFRKFQIRRTSATEEHFQDPSQIERRETMEITIAYPRLPGLYGPNDLDDMEDYIRRDARQIRDLVWSYNTYVSGQNAAFPAPIPAPERGDRVWFQVLTFSLLYYEAQSL